MFWPWGHSTVKFKSNWFLMQKSFNVYFKGKDNNINAIILLYVVFNYYKYVDYLNLARGFKKLRKEYPRNDSLLGNFKKFLIIISSSCPRSTSFKIQNLNTSHQITTLHVLSRIVVRYDSLQYYWLNFLMKFCYVVLRYSHNIS